MSEHEIARIPALTITEFRGGTGNIPRQKPESARNKLTGILGVCGYSSGRRNSGGERVQIARYRSGPRSSNELIEESRASSDDALVYSSVSPAAAPSRGRSGAECPALIIRCFPRTFITPSRRGRFINRVRLLARD